MKKFTKISFVLVAMVIATVFMISCNDEFGGFFIVDLQDPDAITTEIQEAETDAEFYAPVLIGTSVSYNSSERFIIEGVYVDSFQYEYEGELIYITSGGNSKYSYTYVGPEEIEEMESVFNEEIVIRGLDNNYYEKGEGVIEFDVAFKAYGFLSELCEMTSSGEGVMIIGLEFTMMNADGETCICKVYVEHKIIISAE